MTYYDHDSNLHLSFWAGDVITSPARNNRASGPEASSSLSSDSKRCSLDGSTWEVIQATARQATRNSFQPSPRAAQKLPLAPDVGGKTAMTLDTRDSLVSPALHNCSLRHHRSLILRVSSPHTRRFQLAEFLTSLHRRRVFVILPCGGAPSTHKR